MKLDEIRGGISHLFSIKGKKRKKTDAKTKHRQYTKTFVTTITVFAIIWISISYAMGIYALFAYATTDLLSELSQQICITLLGMSLGYFCKAYLETYAEQKNKLAERQMDCGIEFSTVEETATADDGDAVG